jgi:elongation factor G
MDRIGADFKRTLDQIGTKLQGNAIAIQLPIGSEDKFLGMIDLVKMKAITYKDETMGADYVVSDIPAEYLDEAKHYHEYLIEKVSESNDTLLEKYLHGQALTEEEIKAALRKRTIESVRNEKAAFVPVICGSAFKNKGVQPMLDAVVDYLPSPLDVPAAVGHAPGKEDEEVVRHATTEEPFAALAFKIATHPFFGKLTYIRVYSGTVESGSQVINATKGKKERLGKLFQMHSNKENPVERASAGHIYAVIGLKDTTTGDTLSDPNQQVVLESMTFPDPVIEVAIEPRTKSDQEKLSLSIQKLAEEDPTFKVHLDQETGQTVIGGMGELHLDILVDRMRREFKVEANVGKPQVAYKETIKRAVDKVEFTHKKQTGGSGQFAKVLISIEPFSGEDGATYEFENKVTGGRIPREYIPSVDAGAQDAMQYGVLAGYPLVNLKVTLLDGAYHEVDSSEMAFKIAGSQVLKKAAQQAQPVILEPIMAVEVTTPEDYMGDVIGDLNSRRGQIQAMEERSGARVVKAHVPLSEMFGYVGDLRSRTQGRANYSMVFDSYAEVPANVSKEIIAKATGQ